MPKTAVEWTQYNLHGLACGQCGEVTRAGLPPGVPAGITGPRLQAFLAACSAAYRLSKRQIESLLGDGCDFDLSPAAIVGAQQAVSQALAPAVEPTNNQAERALRPAVIWRATSFGTHSPEGSRFVERMLTTVATLRQQGRNVAEFVTATCIARLHGSPSPSLLPPTHLLHAAP